MASPVTPTLPTPLSVQTLRSLYLRGITLGEAWQGPSADAALAQLIAFQLSRAETLMNIQFRPWQVLTAPEESLTVNPMLPALEGPLIPFVPLPPGAPPLYQVALHHHDVQAIGRVRLYGGMTGVPPVPIFTLLDSTQLWFDRLAERLCVPQALVVAPDQHLGWAVDYVFGLGIIPDEVVQWVLLSAAIQTLSLAGVGAGGSNGLARESLTQDGVIETVDYAGTHGQMAAAGGPYAGAISILQRQLDEIDLVKLRFRYQGSRLLGPPAIAPGLGPLGSSVLLVPS